MPSDQPEEVSHASAGEGRGALRRNTRSWIALRVFSRHWRGWFRSCDYGRLNAEDDLHSLEQLAAEMLRHAIPDRA